MDTATDELPAWNSSKDAPLQRTPIEWLSRSYESSEQWKKKAREVFLSVNGESNVARNRVAALVRDYFVSLSSETEAVRRWKKGSDEIETIIMQPPNVSASNAAYFDWVLIADFLLLACASPNEGIPENQTRDTEYRAVLESFRIRYKVFQARMELIAKPGASDEDLRASLSPADPSEVVQAHIDAARRLERSGLPNNAPLEPSATSHVPLFVPIYFRGR